MIVLVVVPFAEGPPWSSLARTLAAKAVALMTFVISLVRGQILPEKEIVAPRHEHSPPYATKLREKDATSWKSGNVRTTKRPRGELAAASGVRCSGGSVLPMNSHPRTP